jgi:hypothetical protein
LDYQGLIFLNVCVNYINIGCFVLKVENELVKLKFLQPAFDPWAVLWRALVQNSEFNIKERQLFKMSSTQILA